MVYSLEELSDSIALIETTLIEHTKCLIEIAKQFDFITEQMLIHRSIEFKRPPKNLPILNAQLEEIEGMARYTLEAVNKLKSLKEETTRGKYPSSGKL